MFGLNVPALHVFAACGKPLFLGILQPWYQYLTLKDDGQGGCKVVNFYADSTKVLGGHSPFLLIALAIVDDLIRIAALIAVGYVMFGGFQYMTSNGSADATQKAQQTIINALIGVVLATLAAGIVAFIGTKLGS